jgi:hypothetical protein
MRLGPGGAPSYGLDVIIGDDCWIGGHVTVLGGVKIGDGCVIGADALVTKVRQNHSRYSYPVEAFRDNIFLYPPFVLILSGPYSIVRGAGRRVTWNRTSALFDEPINSRDFPCLVFSFIFSFFTCWFLSFFLSLFYRSQSADSLMYRIYQPTISHMAHQLG